MNYDVIYYHSPCPDGEAAAYLLAEHGKSFIPYTHGKSKIDLNQVRDGRVLFVDLCPTESILRDVKNIAKSVYVIDHHPVLSTCEKVLSKEEYVVDTSGRRCASQMVWDLLHPHDTPPHWLRVVNLQDTGQFADMTGDDHALHLAFHQRKQEERPYALRTVSELQPLLHHGRRMIEERDIRVESAVNARYSSTLKVREKEYEVVYATITQPADTAPTATKLLELTPRAHFAAIRHPQPTHCNFSLRRRATDTIDLQAIAISMGGGGHHAASAVQKPANTMYL